ncbi:MAG: dUTP diphosphatase [Patescibacteria group bacterium]
MKLLIKKLHPDATIPSFAYTHDAGMDLYATEAVTLSPSEKKIIPTGISVALPEGYVLLIWDKSGIGIKHGIKTLGGVIDAGFRGEIMIGMVNLSSEPYTFEKGHKVAQAVIQKIEQPEIEIVEELPESDRGEGIFGSSGK